MSDLQQALQDLGTPRPRDATAHVSLQIDGQQIQVEEGTSVMRAAAILGVNVPRLCATDNLEAFGSCRMCLVEIEGQKGTPASCTTLVQDGMVVSTQSGKLEKLRKNILELYISDHPLDCVTCPSNGDCELQDVAADLGVEESRYGTSGLNHQQAAKDESNPYFTFDPSMCIVCYRCVRACDDIQGSFALTVDGRGFDSVITAGQKESLLDSECVSCGACVSSCPTTALVEKSVIELGLPGKSTLTTCAYCGVGCAFNVETRGDEVVRMTPYKDGKANEGHACVKGRFAFTYFNHKDRITTPMIRDSIDQDWREVSWPEAIAYTARRSAKFRQCTAGTVLAG